MNHFPVPEGDKRGFFTRSFSVLHHSLSHSYTKETCLQPEIKALYTSTQGIGSTVVIPDNHSNDNRPCWIKPRLFVSVGREGRGDSLGPERYTLHRRRAGSLSSVCTAGLSPAFQPGAGHLCLVTTHARMHTCREDFVKLYTLIVHSLFRKSWH